MLVVVNDKYTHKSPFLVAVGDRVLCPTKGGGGVWSAIVTQLGSTYTGPLKELVGFEDGRETCRISRYRTIDEPWEPQLI